MSAELKQCPLCESEKFEPAYVAKDRHYGISGMYQIVRCAGCSLMFLNPMYSDEELSALYPGDYYAYQDSFSRSRWKEIVKSLLRSEEHTSELQSQSNLVCRLLLEKKKK